MKVAESSIETADRGSPARDFVAVRGVCKSYMTRSGDNVVALRGVNLEIARDEFVTFVGPSGCGKSTLLKLISGHLKPSEGELHVNGRRLEKPSRDIGMVFQRPVLLPWRTVLDNILFPIEMLGWRIGDYMEEANRLIDLVGLRGFERARPDELSGGMQQRVAICRALVYDPQLLLMDEPFAALDAMTREELGMELLNIWTRRRKTVVFVTHSITEAVLLADRVVVMTPRPGQIVEEIPITLPRPRMLGMEFSDAFKDYVERIRGLIHSRPAAPAGNGRAHGGAA
ncbi:MAG TPA: ABC transporter ATP-binding protein [Alphaproteobacteria bacterium]|nr:ABC transporter ATP-binding protein [Alphaproteobacteria bacterium]